MEDKEDDFVLARQGIALLLNNKQEEAESVFSKGKDNVHIAASHCFARFMVCFVLLLGLALRALVAFLA